MPRDFHRSRRIEEQIQRILSEALRQDIRDPRVRHLVLTRVQVSRDLGVARIHYTPLEGGGPDADLQAGLERAAGFLRSRLARELDTRTVPELRFMFDEQGRRSLELDALIDEARLRDDAARPADDAEGREP